jgi:hypothetical protein
LQAFCTYVLWSGCGTRPTDGVAVLLSKLVASLLYLCALARVRDQANRWGCSALEQASCKPSVPMCSGAGCGTSPTDGVAALLYSVHAYCKPFVPRMCTGAGCGTRQWDGVAALLSKLVASLSVPMWRVRDQSRWRGRCSLAHSRCRGGGVAGDQARGRGCFSYSSLPATLHNSFDLHSFTYRITSQICVSLDDLTYSS